MSGQFNLGDISPKRYFLLGSAALGVLFALITPGDFNVEQFTLLLLQWQFQTLVPICIILLAMNWVTKIDWVLQQAQIARLLIGGLLGAVMFSPIAMWFDVVVLGESLQYGFWRESAQEFIALCVPVTLGWLALNLPFLLGYSLQVNPANKSQTSQPATPPTKFMALVPDVVRDEVVLLKSELHYLQVVTLSGKALILYNLEDAIDELVHTSGLRPHRSWWVNRNHIVSVKRKNREGIIEMVSGHRVPVSRRRLQEVLSAVSSS